MHRYAHRNALAQPRPLDAEFRRFWEDAQDVLHRLAARFESSYLEAKELIDELAAEDRPTRADAQQFANHVPHSLVALNRFFTKAVSSGWLPLLRRKGYFDNPPPIDRSDDGGVAFPPWPAARYLERVADRPEAQTAIVEIATGLATENPDAHETFIAAGTKMPADLAVRLVPKAEEWLRAPHQWRLPLRANALASHLAASGRAAEAKRLLKAVLASDRVQRDQHLTREIVEAAAETLFPAVGVAPLDLICDLLERELSRNGEPAPAHDYSEMWRPSIEDARRQDHRDALVSGIRDAAKQLAAADRDNVGEIVALLEAHDPTIFRRIALHLLHVQSDGNADLIAERLGQSDLFLGASFRRETTLLARSHFASLPHEVQARIFAWIEEGPHRPPDDVDYGSWEERVGHWRLLQLSRLGPSLPPEWLAMRAALTERFGEPPDAGAARDRVAVFSAARSPVSLEELRALGPAGVIQKLRHWQPTDDWADEGSVEGLAHELEELVKEEPFAFATRAPGFADLNPTYARALLRALENAARNDTPFPWRPVLELAEAVLTKPRLFQNQREEDYGSQGEPGWIWILREITELIWIGLGRPHSPIPAGERERVWSILSALAEDPQPGPDYEERYGDSMSPPLLSTTAIRSNAIHAVIQYAGWLRRDEHGEAGMAPEAAAILARHLEPEQEPSAVVRAVYGIRFPQLVAIDRAWTEAHADAIFSAHNAALATAAWNAYITSGPSSFAAFTILEQQYRTAVDGLAELDDVEEDGPDVALTKHLHVHYWHGDIDLADGGLMRRFYSTAPLALRTIAFEFIGIELTDVEIENDVHERLAALCEWRFEALADEPDQLAIELAGFGWWFGSGKLESEWSLTQLIRLLENGGGVRHEHYVLQRLVALRMDMPDRVMRALALLVRAAREQWFVMASRDEIAEILTHATSVGGAPATEARALAHRLAAAGDPEFVDLL